ncbi:MAG: zinc-binding dehydrogenase [Candidatus Anammoxibacter sp.]
MLSGSRCEIDTTLIMMKRLKLTGIFIGSQEEIDAMIEFSEEHSIKPVIDCTFPFEKFPEALQHMEANNHFGKIVVEV